MKTFTFYHKHSSICLVISAETEQEAREQVREWTTPLFEEYLRLDSSEEEEEQSDWGHTYNSGGLES